jgi:hypothetical protein
MTFDQIASLGEIIAAVAVIASLIYVARQLSQTNLMMRNAAASERLEREYDLVLPMIESAEFTEIWMKGDNEFHTLSNVEKQRLLFFERRAIVLWHHTFQMKKQNLFSDPFWNETIHIIRTIGSRQAVREAWKIYHGAYETPFVKFVEEQFAIADAEPGDEQ